ncbi:transposase domain-containing protein [Rhizobium rhizosphaerae]
MSESFRLRTTVNDPFAQLTAALTVIANGHKLSRINELLP